jgi:hypothetical protein
VSAQVAPDANGPIRLPLSGSLHYDLRYSQTAQVGDSEDGQQRSIVSGDADYANASQRLPFSLQYGGGYGWTWAGPPAAGNVFQHLSLSQSIAGRAWSLSASDNVLYTFETPTTGFSGVPGSGEPIGGSSPASPPDQTILTSNTRTLENLGTIGLQDRLNFAWSLNVGGTSEQLRYIDNNGQNLDMLMADTGITRRLNALNSISAQYSFTKYSFGEAGFTSRTNSVLFGYRRSWSRRLKTILNAGPQWVSSSGAASTGSMAIPGSTMLSFNASADYMLRRGSASVTCSQGTMGGSGYMLGDKVDRIGANFSHEFAKSLTVGATGSYMRSASLIAAELVFASDGQVSVLPLDVKGVTDAEFGGAQVTRRLGRYASVFGSYTAIGQSSSTRISPLNYNKNILSGLDQVFGFGIGFSPRAMRLKE